jgi:hypothetical protein
MARVLLLTNTLGASAEVLPSLALLQHQVKIVPAEASVLIDVPEADILLLDARRDIPAAKNLAKLLPELELQLVNLQLNLPRMIQVLVKLEVVKFQLMKIAIPRALKVVL